MRPKDAQTKVCATKPTKLFSTEGKRMTEERKQELQQLLEDAMDNLEIQSGGFEGLSVTPDEYKQHLRRSWTSYVQNSVWIVKHFTLDVSANIKSKLLDFIRTEMSPFIYEDKILSPSFFLLSDFFINIMGGHISAIGSSNKDGVNLNKFLEQLLKIAIFRGIEAAVSDFARCTKETGGSFQTITLLSGIMLETEIQVFKGIRLVPIPDSFTIDSRSVTFSTSVIPCYWRNLPNVNHGYLWRKTLLVIDYSVFPIFRNPYLPETEEDKWAMQRAKFRVEGKGEKYPDFDKLDFQMEFCRALSLACNSAVQIAMIWNYIAEDELFNMNGSSATTSFQTSAASIEVGKAQIDEAKNLYYQSVNLNSGLSEKLQIPIDRWIKSKLSRQIKSKTDKSSVDTMIDLGVAFESLFVPPKVPGKPRKISHNLSNNASRYLGTDKTSQEELKAKLKKIYECRCDAVHEGKLDAEVKVEGNTIPMSKFIAEAQDLCCKSIKKILNTGEFPI